MERNIAIKRRALILHGLLICVILACLASCSPAATHILFIGNSYTFYNEGLDRQLAGLSPSTATSLVAVGGYTLEDHWNGGNARQTIRKGGWDYVVLQEQSQRPVMDQAKFFEFTRDFDVAIRASGAKTILLMTWERPDSVGDGVTTAALAKAINSTGEELGIQVAPAGLAFARSLQERPDLALYSPDGHPTVYGTYLAACVLYGTIFGKSPLGNPYADANIPADVRTYLQKIAAQTLGY